MQGNVVSVFLSLVTLSLCLLKLFSFLLAGRLALFFCLSVCLSLSFTERFVSLSLSVKLFPSVVLFSRCLSLNLFKPHCSVSVCPCDSFDISFPFCHFACSAFSFFPNFPVSHSLSAAVFFHSQLTSGILLSFRALFIRLSFL